jgi:hypothetical protein
MGAIKQMLIDPSREEVRILKDLGYTGYDEPGLSDAEKMALWHHGCHMPAAKKNREALSQSAHVANFLINSY